MQRWNFRKSQMKLTELVKSEKITSEDQKWHEYLDTIFRLNQAQLRLQWNHSVWSEIEITIKSTKTIVRQNLRKWTAIFITRSHFMHFHNALSLISSKRALLLYVAPLCRYGPMTIINKAVSCHNDNNDNNKYS